MRRYIAALAILGIVVAHITRPAAFPLDWQSIALLGVVLVLFLSPELAEILPFIKRLKVGAAEVELFQRLGKLNKDLDEAEDTGAVWGLRRSQGVLRDVDDSIDEASRRIGRTLFVARGGSDTETQILDLAGRDKESAIVRLGIEIERALLNLTLRESPTDAPPKTIRDKVRRLVSEGALSPAIGNAIIEFRDVRNQVIHPSTAAPINERILTSAIDSGLRILRLMPRET